MKIKYTTKSFQKKTTTLIIMANQIIDEYLDQGFKLTLRQLYYQFVARGYLPNQTSMYDKLGYIVSDARLAGEIDWDAIEDRTRNLQLNSHWTDPGAIIRSARYSFKLDHWEDQPYRVEVWIEKEALVGVISDICGSLDVPYFACKGYVSQSEMWKAAQRMVQYEQAGQGTIIIHLGDHDPSGIDMSRDIQNRLNLFRANTDIERIALNMDQVETFDPPPNPAKVTDSRFKDYAAKYGNESWELDALDPVTLKSLIEDTVHKYRDRNIYNKIIDQENEYIKTLKNIEENWETL